jgi:hypothetical protein
MGRTRDADQRLHCNGWDLIWRVAVNRGLYDRMKEAHEAIDLQRTAERPLAAWEIYGVPAPDL